MPTKRAVIYTRVSSERQIDGYSLEVQEDRCRQRADALGYEIPENGVFREEGVSAKNMERPELQLLLRYCVEKKNEISAVIVLDISRFNRNTADFLSVQAILAKHGVKLIFCSHDNNANAESKLINTVLASLAEYDNTKKGEKVVDSMKKRFELGRMNNKPGVGYLLVGKKVVKDPDTFETIQQMWYKIVKLRWSLQKVADELNRLGIKPTHNKNCKGFTRRLCSQLFSNKFYMGVITSERFGEAKGEHESMVDERTFYQVREIITSRRPSRKENYLKLNPDYPLRGVLKCVHCGGHVSGSPTTGKNKSKPIRYYMCETRGVHKPNPSFPADDNAKRKGIETHFMELMENVVFEDGFIHWITEMVKEAYEAKYKVFVKSEQQAEREVKETMELQKELNLKYLKKEFTKDEYESMKKDLEIQLVMREGVLSERKMAKLDIDIILSWIEFYLTHIPRIWLDAEPEARYRIGCSLFPSGLQYDGQKFRTPTLGIAYRLTSELRDDSVRLGDPRRIRIAVTRMRT